METPSLLKTVYSLSVVSVLLSSGALAQSADSLVRLLGSPDWQTRSRAVARLNQVPVPDLPPTFASTAIALLEREATRADPERGEGYGEYVLHLVQGVLRINDDRSLRGMALVGIQTGRGPTEFVAKQGARAIPYLDEAWARDTLGRPAIVRTWGWMLGRYGHVLARADSISLMVRLLRAARDQPQGFTWAAEIAQLAEAVPIVERIAKSHENEIVRRRAETVSAKLRARRESLPTADLAGRLDKWVFAACDARRAAGRGACDRLITLSGDATNQIRTRGVRPADAALHALAQEGDRAFNEGVLDEAARELIIANAEYLMTRQ